MPRRADSLHPFLELAEIGGFGQRTHRDRVLPFLEQRALDARADTLEPVIARIEAYEFVFPRVVKRVFDIGAAVRVVRVIGFVNQAAQLGHARGGLLVIVHVVLV